MADIILTPIAELIIQTLSSTAVQEIQSLYGAKSELRKLESTLSTIRAVLVDAEKRQIREEQVRDWLEKLEAVLYDADDLVDEVNTEGSCRKLMDGKKIRKKVRTFLSSNNQLVFGPKMAREIKTIRERLDAISADKERFHLEVRQEIIQPERNKRETGAFVDEENVVGREGEMAEIIKRLMSSEVETGTGGSRTRRERVSVIPIVGMGGVGKTTLAQLVYNDRAVKKHFNLRLWVCVSDNVDSDPLIVKVVRSITSAGTKFISMPKLEETVAEEISGKRFLLILDDVWKQEINQEWKDSRKKLC